ncbi:MAG TPA: DUF3301 domain-containing protein [Gammaproteobacteria bacterium]|nr:DUF3301 domain-containing protein [Gammaproteobacteria bacterium]
MNGGLILLLCLGLALWFWQDTLRVREQAQSVAQELCRRQQLQFLDGTVSLQHIGLRRSDRGRLRLHRTFQFSYSTDGVERRTGFIITLGNHVEQAGL